MAAHEATVAGKRKTSESGGLGLCGFRGAEEGGAGRKFLCRSWVIAEGNHLESKGLMM